MRNVTECIVNTGVVGLLFLIVTVLHSPLTERREAASAGSLWEPVACCIRPSAGPCASRALYLRRAALAKV
jgi:hypothetical protein